MSDDDLRPCPFCGGRAEYRYLPNIDRHKPKPSHKIVCVRCHVFVERASVRGAYERWNKRAPAEDV